jgi:origin recognition complex subunit 3
MCHFYANALSVTLSESSSSGELDFQPELLEAVRSLPSFRHFVENAVEANNLAEARSLLKDDEYLTRQIRSIATERDIWTKKCVRSVQILAATGVLKDGYSQVYIKAISDGLDLSSDDISVIESVKRMQPGEIISLLERVIETIQQGESSSQLLGWSAEEPTLIQSLQELLSESKTLKQKSQDKGATLHSAYSGQSKVLRTTVVAQKVQLSRDSAALTEEDKEFTQVIDRVIQRLQAIIQCNGVTSVFLHEAWLYDSKSPYRDIFIPRPRAVLERGLLHPGDYLGCSCCTISEESLTSTLPVTSLLYRLYLETGNLINIADLWSAFYALVGDEEETGKGHDERTALTLFYQGLAELKALGFVKASKKKTDHVAKLKWL